MLSVHSLRWKVGLLSPMQMKLNKTTELEVPNWELVLEMPNKTKQTQNKKSKSGFARNLNEVFTGRFLTREYVQENLGFIFFCVFIMVSYIGYGYFAEKNLKDLAKSESDLQELKARNLSTHARLEQLKQQSQVARSIEELGLVESTSPPVILRVDEKQSKSLAVNE